jgi:hypothetical protein
MSPRAADPGELVRRTAAVTRRRRRLERALVATPPALAAASAAALGLAPAPIAAAVVALALGAALLGRNEETEAGSARRLDRSLDAKDAFLTVATVPAEARGPLWPAVVDGAARAGGAESLLASTVALALLVFAPEWIRPHADSPLARLAGAADRLAESGAAGGASLAAELRALVETLEDPEVSAEEKRRQVEQTLSQMKERSGESGESAAAKAEAGEQRGEGETGASAEGAGAEAEAREALEQLRRDLGGESGSAEQSGGAEQEAEPKQTNAGGGVEAPGEGREPGEKPSDAPGNEPASGGSERSEQGEGEGGNESRDRPPDRDGRSGGANPQSGDQGSGSAERPSPSEAGEPAERYYPVGDGPGGFRLDDEGYVRVLVPESGEGVGVDRVRKPGDPIVETPFGNAPLPSAGPTGAAEARQRVPLEYRPLLRP